MPNVTNTRGTSQSLLSTELNSLANNANAVHASSVTLTNQGYRTGRFELVVTFGTAPTAGTSLVVWLLTEIDGTNFEDGSASVTPLRPPDLIFPLRAVTTAQRIAVYADLPEGLVRPLLRNAGTNQAMAASGNTLIVRAVTETF
jgi:hypothetical protein